VFAAAAIKDLAMAFFRFDSQQLAAAANVQRDKHPEYKNLSTAQLVNKLPLKTWQNTVRRVYLPGGEQVAALEKWSEKYIYSEAVFVDGNGRTLIAGGQDGFDAFARVFQNQMALARDEYLSGEQAWSAAAAGLLLTSSYSSGWIQDKQKCDTAAGV
jgi:predicted membrane-bound spermidine synthase